MRKRRNSRKKATKPKVFDRPLSRLTKKKRLRNYSGAITTNFTEIKIIREYYEHLYANKLDILDEMDKFLKTQFTNAES